MLPYGKKGFRNGWTCKNMNFLRILYSGIRNVWSGRKKNHLICRVMIVITAAKGWSSLTVQITITKRKWLCRSAEVIGYICHWVKRISNKDSTGTDYQPVAEEIALLFASLPAKCGTGNETAALSSLSCKSAWRR